MPFGPVEIVLIVVLLLLLFGAKRIPLIARGLGESIRNFKGEVKGDDDRVGPGGRDDGEGRGRDDRS